MLVFPAIDLLGGRCVRLFQGDYGQATTYANDPVELARGFESEGSTWVHVVDLDGAKAGMPEHLHAVRRIREQTGLHIQFGGGVRSLEVARQVLAAGADRCVVGTRLVQDDELAAQLFDELGEAVVAGIDSRDGVVTIRGWTELSGIEALPLARRMEALGCRRIVFTDVATDGALTGPNLAATRAVVGALSIPVIASGGVASLDDLDELAATGAEGAIVGRALYEGRFRLRDALDRHLPT